jgi:hypothetical protein
VRRATLLLLVALAIAGCGGGSSSRGKSAEKLANDAQQAAETARAVHISGSFPQPLGGNLVVDMRLVRNVGAKGQFRLSGGKVDLVRVGQDVYLKANAPFWLAISGDAAAKALKDRWIRVPPGQKGLQPIIGFTDLDQLIAGTIGARGEVSEKGTKDYKSREVIVIDDSGGSGGTFYIAASGKPYPVAILSPNNGEKGTLDFGDWNKTVAIAAPKGAVDLSKLGRIR